LTAAPIVRSSNLQFFLARAAQAREEGEAAWTALADRAQRSEQLREAEVERKQQEGLKSQ
jgi:hypothetical protein